jgi:hypothetical protein
VTSLAMLQQEIMIAAVSELPELSSSHQTAIHLSLEHFQ